MNQPSSSMQLTRAADYGVRVMVHLAHGASQDRQSLSTLAKIADAPESFLSKVLQALVRAELIDSRRGQTGGFKISERGRTATIRSVIEAIEGPINLNLCLISDRSCHRSATCPAHPLWARAQDAMFAVLDSATVTELAGQPSISPTQNETAFANSLGSSTAI